MDGSMVCRHDHCFLDRSMVLAAEALFCPSLTGALFWLQEHCFVDRSIVLSTGAMPCRPVHSFIDRSMPWGLGPACWPTGLGPAWPAGNAEKVVFCNPDAESVVFCGLPGAWGRPGACLAGLKRRKRRILRNLGRPGKSENR